MASFWKGASEKAVGKVFLEALKQTLIGESEVKDLAMMLAEISERTTYDWEQRKREAEKSQDFETLRENRCSANSGIGFGQNRKSDPKENRKSDSKDERKSDPKEDRNLTEEDLIEYGNVRREIVGRIQQIVVLDNLDATDFEQIMKSPKPMSPIRQIEEQYEVTMEIDDRMRQNLARRAADSGLGCRYIRSQIQGMLDEKIFDEPEQTRFLFFLPKE